MELTYAKDRADLEEIADLMSKVFVRGSYFDFYRTRMDYQTRDPYYRPEHSRLIKVDGRIVSHASIVEKRMRIGRGVVKVAGIGDVFTHPEHRGQSYSRLIMEDAIKYMREHDYPLSMLYGIPDYYHKFGYIEAMGTCSVFLQVKCLEGLEGKGVLRPGEEKDVPRLNALYNKAYGRKTGAAERVEAHWYKVLGPRSLTVLEDDSGRVAGYAVTPAKRSGELYLSEAVAPDLDAARSLLGHFGRLARERYLSELELRMAPDHFLAQYAQLIGCRLVTRFFGEGEGQAMLRTIDLFQLLEAIREELEQRLAVSAFQNATTGFNLVTDEAGEAGLELEGGKIRLSPQVHAGRPTLELPQNLLTRTLVGYWSVGQLRMRHPRPAIPRELETLLDALFPPQLPLMCEADYF